MAEFSASTKATIKLMSYPYTHPNVPNLFRESARRMRAKRNQEAVQLETTVNQLKSKNKQLEKQNKAYAKSMQQLQAEMLTLKTQLQQHTLSAAQQQQQLVQQQDASSELHQVGAVCS